MGNTDSAVYDPEQLGALARDSSAPPTERLRALYMLTHAQLDLCTTDAIRLSQTLAVANDEHSGASQRLALARTAVRSAQERLKTTTDLSRMLQRRLALLKTYEDKPGGDEEDLTVALDGLTHAPEPLEEVPTVATNPLPSHFPLFDSDHESASSPVSN